jgi:hypothetical protein
MFLYIETESKIFIRDVEEPFEYLYDNAQSRDGNHKE